MITSEMRNMMTMELLTQEIAKLRLELDNLKKIITQLEKRK